MKANEAHKSKFVYPDKLYARCKDNKTLDMSYAPFNMEAVEYIRTDAFIDKAADWLFHQANYYTKLKIDAHNGGVYTDFYADKMVNDFKKAMTL